MLIGTNVDGFQAYMREAFEDCAEWLSLWPSNTEDTLPQDMLGQQAIARRSPTSMDAVAGRLAMMLRGLGAEAVTAHTQPSEDLDFQFRQLLWRWIEDPLTSGADVIETICASTPPGFRNRIMGLQNIKGTGLGFVYAWQAWDACAKACAQLLNACWDDAPPTLQQRLEPYRPIGLRP